jgi:hypothetical protein
LAFVVAAHGRARQIDAASAPGDAVHAERAGGLFEFFDMQHLAAMGARAAGFSRDFQHGDRCAEQSERIAATVKE